MLYGLKIGCLTFRIIFSLGYLCVKVVKSGTLFGRSRRSLALLIRTIRRCPSTC